MYVILKQLHTIQKWKKLFKIPISWYFVDSVTRYWSAKGRDRPLLLVGLVNDLMRSTQFLCFTCRMYSIFYYFLSTC